YSFVLILFFVFQAEDGIRDRNVTGVQTCALPIWRLEPPGTRPGHDDDHGRRLPRGAEQPPPVVPGQSGTGDRHQTARGSHAFRRSEERRVGKECRSRGTREQYKEHRQGSTATTET